MISWFSRLATLEIKEEFDFYFDNLNKFDPDVILRSDKR